MQLFHDMKEMFEITTKNYFLNYLFYSLLYFFRAKIYSYSLNKRTSRERKKNKIILDGKKLCIIITMPVQNVYLTIILIPNNVILEKSFSTV